MNNAPPLTEDERRELAYLRKNAERSAAKVMQLDLQSIAIRNELEQKRRGFRLMASLASALAKKDDEGNLFDKASRRINAALNMQRTAILLPVDDGLFIPGVLHGYPPVETASLSATPIRLPFDFTDSDSFALVTGADPDNLYADFRQTLALPYFIACPIIMRTKIVALVVTGRLTEEIPFLVRLGPGDVETVQTLCALLAAVLSERKLAETEERTQIMLDATPMGCTFWDETGTPVDCNAEAVRLFGLASKQEYLENFFMLYPERQPDGSLSRKVSQQKVQQVLQTGYDRFEWVYCTKHGDLFPAEITLVRCKNASGTGSVIAYTRDLREHRAMLAEIQKTQDNLRLARDLAENTAKAKSEFLANMSHELRTPMNAVIGMTHLLANTELSSKQAELVDKARYSAQLLLHIINDVLDFSKLDANKMTVENVEFSPQQILDNVMHMVQVQAKDEHLELTMTISPDVPQRILGDPMRMQQILLNLSSNALKFTHEGGVALAVSVVKRVPKTVSLRFEVTDTGIGMTEEQVANLFTPFMQADTSTTRKYGGTGLGLAISRGLVEAMGGTLQCDSISGRGSTFFFTVPFPLPDEEPDTPALSAEATPVQTSSLEGMRVLLAEDNAINQFIAIELLSSFGVEVLTADNGQIALDILEKEPVDLVLMDIQMPEMDGFTATERIRATPHLAHLPVIAMTAHALPGDREKSLQGGMDAHITKPIEPKDLLTVLQYWRDCKNA